MLTDFYELSADFADIKIKSNYHTHNYLCGHARGTVSDYVGEAVRCGLDVIGISDHVAPPIDTGVPYVTLDALPREYLSQFDVARKAYGDRIKILSAAEMEYYDGHDEYYRALLGKLDYLIIGQHEYILDGERKNSFADGVDERNVVAYFRNVIRALETGMFKILAHPDVIFYHSPELTPKIVDAFEETIATAVRLGIVLELNANGIRCHGFRYPTDLLIELYKRYDAKVLVSSDCHVPKVLCDECTLRLYAYAQRKGLNVVDTI